MTPFSSFSKAVELLMRIGLPEDDCVTLMDSMVKSVAIEAVEQYDKRISIPAPILAEAQHIEVANQIAAARREERERCREAVSDTLRGHHWRPEDHALFYSVALKAIDALPAPSCSETPNGSELDRIVREPTPEQVWLIADTISAKTNDCFHAYGIAEAVLAELARMASAK